MTPLWKLLFLLNLSQTVTVTNANKSKSVQVLAFQQPQSRRNVVQNAFKWFTVQSTLTVTLPKDTFAITPPATQSGQQPSSPYRYNVYRVMPDASTSLAPTIQAVNPQKFCEHLSLCNDKIITNKNGGAIWLGEHHNSEQDHLLQANFIQTIYEKRKKYFLNTKNNYGDVSSLPPMSIGLEQVQVQFQPILDAYVDGEILEKEMLELVQWEKRWTWDFKNYKPIFDLAKELKIRLVALNVNSEDLAVVEEFGIQGLSKEQLRRYIKNPKAFGDFANQQSFKSYVSYVIEPSYELHQQIGLLRNTMSGKPLGQEMSFRNFFSARILWDESMAGNAYSWNMKNPGGLMVGLVGADHIKFEKGVAGRYNRLVNDSRQGVSVLLNPTLIDTRPSGSINNYASATSSSFPDQITLQLRYLKDDGVDSSSQENRNSLSTTGGVLSLADYIVISKKN